MRPHAPYAVLGVTSDDLYAGAATQENHYTGGLTDMMGRAGVYSFARSLDVEAGGGDHAEGEAWEVGDGNGLPPPLVLERALKVITHELCHAFGHQHCVHFNCV